MLRELREPLVLIMEFFLHGGVRNEYANYLRTIPILRHQNNWTGGWVRKIDIRFLLMSSTAQRKLERLQFSTSSSFVKI